MPQREELIKEHSDLLEGFESFEVISPNDPDLLRMEEIMEELKEIEEKED